MAWVGALVGVAANYLLADDGGGGGSSGMSAAQAAIAADQWQHYKDNIEPLEIGNAEQAANYASIANKEKSAAQATADVSAKFAGLRDKLNKAPGFNPNSEAYQRVTADIGLTEAAQKATAATAARDKVQALGDAKVTDAISLGKGLAANAQTGLASAAAQAAASARQSNLESQQMGQAIGGIVGSKGFQNWASGLGKSDGYVSTQGTGASITGNEGMTSADDWMPVSSNP